MRSHTNSDRTCDMHVVPKFCLYGASALEAKQLILLTLVCPRVSTGNVLQFCSMPPPTRCH